MAIKPSGASGKKKGLIPPKYKKFAWIGGILLFSWFIYMMAIPPQGTIQYGICKVFVELIDPYPQNLKILSVDNFIRKIRMSYKKYDTFGNEQVNEIECYFKMDVQNNPTTIIEKIDINGKARPYAAEDPDFVAKFNKTIPAIVANPPDLSLPYYNLDDIMSYKDTDIN